MGWSWPPCLRSRVTPGPGPWVTPPVPTQSHGPGSTSAACPSHVLRSTWPFAWSAGLPMSSDPRSASRTRCELLGVDRGRGGNGGPKAGSVRAWACEGKQSRCATRGLRLPARLMSSVKDNVGRGLNIALVNGVSGELIEARAFDMWAGDVNDLLKFIRPLHEGTLVFVASYDDPATKMNEETRKLFSDLGSKNVKDLAFRDSWVFVGAKGVQNKSPFEQHVKNSKHTNKYEGWPEALEMEGCIPRRTMAS
uniref:FAM3 metabolism regulating signaling molecule A n=1 Tax=Equus asinus TaxID=9793 RepID=A0A9L0IA93_EQUAS